MAAFLPSDYRADLRIGTAEREQAATQLAEHFSAGRLTTDEFDERVRQAYQARTDAELRTLFRDLPRSQSEREKQPNWYPYRRRLGLLRVVLLVAAVVAWVAIVHLPPFFLIPLLWFSIARSRRRFYRLAHR